MIENDKSVNYSRDLNSLNQKGLRSFFCKILRSSRQFSRKWRCLQDAFFENLVLFKAFG